MALCEGIDVVNSTGLIGILNFPTICDAQFYAKIMGAIFMILTLTLFFREKDEKGEGDFLSAMGVSAIAVIVISLIGTYLTIIQPQIFIEILVLCLIVIAIWLVKD